MGAALGGASGGGAIGVAAVTDPASSASNAAAAPRSAKAPPAAAPLAGAAGELNVGKGAAARDIRSGRIHWRPTTDHGLGHIQQPARHMGGDIQHIDCMR